MPLICNTWALLIILLLAAVNHQSSSALTISALTSSAIKISTLTRSALTSHQVTKNNRLLLHLEPDDQGDRGICKRNYCHYKDEDECRINHHLINPQDIKKTREENLKCSSVDVSCDDVKCSRYRSYDGSCNNLKHPSWGKSNNCLRRLLPYDYADGISEPRKSCTGCELPNPRNISNIFHRETRVHKDKFTVKFMEVGQFIAHDVSNNDIIRSVESGGNAPIRCCTYGPNISDQCISCSVPHDDPFYVDRNVTCLNLVRTVPCPLCKTGKRQHWNQNTAYLDLSTVYGSNQNVSMSLRKMKDGKLIVQENNETGPLLPGVQRALGCTTPPNSTTMCFKSGDPRTQQNTLILAFHTMFMRHHNYVCSKLKKVNPHWDDETLYQHARRICIAHFQKIVFGDYLPHVLGPDIMKEDNLGISPDSSHTTYNPDADASITDEFTAAAQRFGHNQIPEHVLLVDPKTGCQSHAPFRNQYFYPFEFYGGQFDQLVLGMTKEQQRKQDRFFVDDVRNFLYRSRVQNSSTGGDLVSTTIARGRDHGFPAYPYYLSYCFNYTVKSFCDLEKFIPCKRIKLLRKIYKSVHDIDMYVGGLSEYKIKGGMVGPTFACILRIQYKNMKFADRFFFQHKGQKGSFTRDQLKALTKVRLEYIICQNSKVEEIQKNVFYPPSLRNPIVPCSSIPQFDYSSFKEDCSP